MRIGVIGLGQMGEGVAVNLAKAGYPLTVFDVRPEPIERLVAAGATGAASAYEVGRSSEVVFVVVFSDDQARDVSLGSGDDQGVVAGLPEGAVLILQATMSPKTVQEIADVGAQRGVAVIDAAMTGGSGAAAMAGELTLMVGGDTEVVERVRPLMEAVSVNIFHVGALGQGVTAKIANNLVNELYVMAIRSGLTIAAAAGIAPEKMLQILNDGRTSSSWPSLNWDMIRRMEEAHPRGVLGLVEMTEKDLSLAVKLSKQFGAPIPLAEVALTGMLPKITRGLTTIDDV
jgi:3-hydroxyisobutyrate dehydrogenase-like beta-hydroxyacid dehydrogenase